VNDAVEERRAFEPERFIWQRTSVWIGPLNISGMPEEKSARWSYNVSFCSSGSASSNTATPRSRPPPAAAPWSGGASRQRRAHPLAREAQQGDGEIGARRPKRVRGEAADFSRQTPRNAQHERKIVWRDIPQRILFRAYPTEVEPARVQQAQPAQPAGSIHLRSTAVAG